LACGGQDKIDEGCQANRIDLSQKKKNQITTPTPS
jgi:hypothetical protein